MPWLREFVARFAALFRKRRLEQEMNEELRAHLEMLIEENVQRGLSREEARYAASRSFGGVGQVKENYREQRGLIMFETLVQDLRFGLRMLLKHPGFTGAAVLVLALGIGLNSAIFSAVYAALLKPLPFRDSGRLVFVRKKNPPRGWMRNQISPVEILEWRKQTPAFEDIAAFTGATCVITGAGEPEELPCETPESNLFDLLGVAPLRGRAFSPEEDKQGGPHAAILSYGLWQRHFGGDARAIGRAIEVNGNSYSVVGVMPASIAHLYASPYGAIPELWLSGIVLSPTSTWNDYFAIARLKPGTTLKQAEMQMDTASASIERAFPDLKGWRADAVDLRDAVSGDLRLELLVLLGAVTFVLLIACANVANLMLAHGAGRANEFAVRKALGGGQGRIIRQVLTESLMISIVGGSLGILLASWGTKVIALLAPPALLNTAPGLAGGGLDGRVLMFAVAVTMATSLLFGLAPALRGARRDVNDSLKETGRSALESARSRHFRDVLVVAEIALSMVLLIGAGLMIRTLGGLRRLKLGFSPANVLTMRVGLFGPRYKEPQTRAEFWRRTVESVEALPGVESASVARGLPIGDWAGQFFTTADRPNPPEGQVPDANYVVAGSDYFHTFQIPLRAGRSFTEYDGPNADRVVIVNEELARENWPGENPLGKQLRMGSGASKAPWLTVIGVAGNVLSQGRDVGFHSEVYVPYQQYPWVLTPSHLVVRAKAGLEAASLSAAMVREIHRIDANQPVADIKTMDAVAADSIADERMVMALLGAFAALALILSAVGTYSVLAYSVAQRAREIGVRMALGARPNQVLRMVLGEGTRLAFIGIAAGIAAALGLTRLLTELLYGVQATDPATFVSVAVFLGGVSLAACYIPARRAAKVDPMVALRYE